MGIIRQKGRLFQFTCDVCGDSTLSFVEPPTRLKEEELEEWAKGEDARRKTYCDKPPKKGELSCHAKALAAPERQAALAKNEARRKVAELLREDPDLLLDLIAEKAAERSSKK